jgi:hypothetical protein
VTIALATSAILPALAWYAHAVRLLNGMEGSHASTETARLWLEALGPAAWLDGARWRLVAWFVLVRSFTPMAWPLIAAGWWLRTSPPRSDRLWAVYAAAAICGLAGVAGKLHHEYYLLVLAPVVAVGVARGLTAVGDAMGRWPGLVVAVGFFGLCAAQTISTFRLPTEWSRIEPAARRVQAVVPPSDAVVATEALLFQANRRGARLEFGAESSRRAAAEWAANPPVARSEDLVVFYASRGLRFFADLVPEASDAERVALHESLRRRYTEVEAGPDVLILRLDRP